MTQLPWMSGGMRARVVLWLVGITAAACDHVINSIGLGRGLGCFYFQFDPLYRYFCIVIGLHRVTGNRRRRV
ncbi:hypothetical protein BKA91DRAFT_137280 [Yarrowia lipolytica]|nr:hypothetical protein BKA91DRAFT_137280 [Yarrowia lipolytica]KAE8173896.1 hypothetical protein BKA90DRAFT_134838 [Yarrowia lipolytica]RMI95887.1 hypothetical protein BD777DRAFT_129120 [Yarrowia lipolytica]